MSYYTNEQRRNARRHIDASLEKRRKGVKSATTLAAEAAKAYAEQQAKGEAALSEDAIKKFLMLTPSELNVLAMIASGRPPRHSVSILAAIKLKLEYTVKKPETEAQRSAQPVTVIIHSLADQPPPTVELADPADPAPPENVQ